MNLLHLLPKWNRALLIECVGYFTLILQQILPRYLDEGVDLVNVDVLLVFPLSRTQRDRLLLFLLHAQYYYCHPFIHRLTIIQTIGRQSQARLGLDHLLQTDVLIQAESTNYCEFNKSYCFQCIDIAFLLFESLIICSFHTLSNLMNWFEHCCGSHEVSVSLW